MSKITNNENMRRYVHMKLSNGGSGSGSGSGCSCPPPMIVEGTFEDGPEQLQLFQPLEGSPTWTEASNHMVSGGVVYVMSISNDEPEVCELATTRMTSAIFGAHFVWSNPNSDIPHR